MSDKRAPILAHLRFLRESRPRHFWGTAAVGAASLFGMVTAFAVAPSTAELQATQQFVTEPLQLPRLEPLAHVDSLFIREERVERGDSVASLFGRLGVDDPEALDYLRRDAKAKDVFRQLKPGRAVTAKMTRDGRLSSLMVPLNEKDRALIVERIDGKLAAAEQTLQIETRITMKSGEIAGSLFSATDDAGLPDNVAVQLGEIFGGEIDFHRDLRRGDRFTVLFEMAYHLGQPLRAVRILAAEFTTQGKSHRAVHFATGDGHGSYYTPEGRNLKKAFLRSPLEFSRITSGFAMRVHPITQDWRAHKGVDYSAPVGTKVRATADGVVDFIGRQNGYGNIIVLRHQGRYSTHYGHLNAFAAGLKKGARVGQGDLIGYVGMTGWTTGPHLHYEFRVDNIHQNPLSAAMPIAVELNPQQLARFRQDTQPLLARMTLTAPLSVAQLD
jgi:murein DD-endopeptidase MepM/ murein hydrolase activator NlpD